ncbi:MAG: ACT domain-containing protein [Anaerolineae bacterium]|nr:ACT domain-containing protein [Anaerolineae bacterium]
MQTVEQVLAQTKLYTDETDYAVLHLPATAIMVAAGIIAEISEPFCTLVVDKNEVTLIIPNEAIGDFAKRLHKHDTAEKLYRLITLDIELDMDLIGFMARISTALASNGVSILPIAAFSRDHILVPAPQFSIAMQTLEKLISGQ